MDEEKKIPYTFTVVKNGVSRTITIDLHKNEELMRNVQKMNMSKKCADIFKNVVIQKDQEKIRMYSHKNNNKFFRDKRLRNELIMNISKLKLILGMRSITGMIYIRALLDKINYVKKLFTYQIEDDAEVFIPVDLSQSGLPISFRYYDPLILIV